MDIETSTKTDEGHDSPGIQLCDFLNWHVAFHLFTGGDVCLDEM
jgi:hypothetical protein